MKEWYYTGNAYDLEEAEETCELCGHQGLRFQFEIENRFNGNALLVGSKCIKKFDISAVDESGALLDKKASRLKVESDRHKN